MFQNSLGLMNTYMLQLEMEVECLMKQLEYLDKLEAEEEKMKHDSAGTFSSGKSLERSGNRPPQEFVSNGARNFPGNEQDPKQSRADTSGEARPRDESPTKRSSDHKRDSDRHAKSQFDVVVGPSVKQRPGDQSQRELKKAGGRSGHADALQDSLVALGIAEVPGPMDQPTAKSMAKSQFHKFSPRSFSKQLPPDSTVSSPGTMPAVKGDRLSVSPIHNDRRGFNPSSFQTDASFNPQSEFGKGESKLSGLPGHDADRKRSQHKARAKGRDPSSLDSQDRLHQRVGHAQGKGKDRGGGRGGGSECLEESVDEESSAVDIDEPVEQSVRAPGEGLSTGKSTRSRSVLQSVNRR
jgi:hypothetical protein